NALASAWPGNGLPNWTQSRYAHGPKTNAAISPTKTTDGHHWPNCVVADRSTTGRPTDEMPRIGRTAPAATARPATHHATIAHVSASHSASLRVSAARPSTIPTSHVSRARARAYPRAHSSNAVGELEGTS